MGTKRTEIVEIPNLILNKSIIGYHQKYAVKHVKVKSKFIPLHAPDTECFLKMMCYFSRIA